MIYTGYYSKIKDYRDAGLKVVSISRTMPDAVNVDGKIPFLCPDDSLLFGYKNGEIDEMEYTSKYLHKLGFFGAINIIQEIRRYGNNVVLLCWEAPDKFCHRHILADYLNKNSKVNVTEFGYTPEESLF